MAAKTTLNAKNLEALGTERLAELLIELSTGSAAHKRRLRLELAGSHSSAEVAREVRKRLSSIARARTRIDWRKVKRTVADLETQRKTIVETVAADDPAEAFELIWQFLALAEPIFERSNDSSGALLESFHQACEDAGAIAKAANIEIGTLAEKTFNAVHDNAHGQFDGLIAAMAPALGKEGLERVKALFQAWSSEPEETPADKDRKIIGWGSTGAVYEDDVYGKPKDVTIRRALEKIADAQGDVDAYIAQQPEKTRSAPGVATEIANRLIDAGRAEEALKALDAVGSPGHPDLFSEWRRARADALEALARGEEAQAFRWQGFEQSLNGAYLQAYIARLPDFDDVEAEEKAFAYVQGFADVHRALHFFLEWPRPLEAAKLVTQRGQELDGDRYELMTQAAEMLSARHPLAATIVLRSMIDFSLERARSGRYKHAARHLVECASLARQIEDFGAIRPHETYVSDLKREHRGKAGFWNLV